MTIKDIPQDFFPPREGIITHSYFAQSLRRDGADYQKLIAEDEEWLSGERFKAGIRILKEAQVPDILAELIDVASPQKPDIGFGRLIGRGFDVSQDAAERTIPEFRKMTSDGRVVGTRVVWDYQKEEFNMWNSLSVSARVLTGEIIIEGRDTAIISPSAWSAEDGRLKIEESVCNAFLQPGYIGKIFQSGLVRLHDKNSSK